MELIFLIGPPGSGKTACGQELSRLLACPFHDTDQLIEKRHGKTVKQIFAEHGESHFRTLETQLLDELQSAPQTSEQPAVFATGGGLPIYNNNLQRLKRLGKVVSLSARLPILCQRLKNCQDRPLLSAPADLDADKLLEQRLAELIESRSPVYEEAGYKIDTSGLKPAEVAYEIMRVLYPNRS